MKLRTCWAIAAAAALMALVACSTNSNATREYDLKYPRVFGGPN